MRRLLRPAKAAASVAAATAVAVSLADVAYADGVFPFRRQPAAPPPPPPATPPGAEPAPAVVSSGSNGFDPEDLEAGARALREINGSPYAKLLFELMRKQEESRLAEVAAEQVQFEIYRKLKDIERKKKLGEEYRENLKQQLQVEAQRLRYDDELARKRIQTEREAQRRQDAELVRMQEIAAMKREEARRDTQHRILAEELQTQKERAENERKTNQVNAISDAEARVYEKKLTEDYDRKMLLERMNGEKEKWLAAINTTFSHVEVGRVCLEDLITKRKVAAGG